MSRWKGDAVEYDVNHFLQKQEGYVFQYEIVKGIGVPLWAVRKALQRLELEGEVLCRRLYSHTTFIHVNRALAKAK